jgi:hypothetical protein
MLLTEVWMLDKFLTRFPPTDLLMAGQLNYKAPEPTASDVSSMAAAKRSNSAYMKELPPRRNVMTLEQIPARFRGPDMLAVIERMKAECRTS